MAEFVNEDAPRRMSLVQKPERRASGASTPINKPASPVTAKLGDTEFTLNALLSVGIDFTALQTMLATMVTKINDQDGAILSLKKEVSLLRERDYERNNTIHGLKTQVASQQETISSQAETINAFNVQREELLTRVTQVETRLVDLEERTSGQAAASLSEDKRGTTPAPGDTNANANGASSGDMTTLSTQVTDLDDKLRLLSESVAHLQLKGDVPTVTRLGSLAEIDIPLDLAPLNVDLPTVDYEDAVHSATTVGPDHDELSTLTSTPIPKTPSPRPISSRNATSVNDIIESLREEMHALDNVRANAYNSLLKDFNDLRQTVEKFMDENGKEERRIKRRPPRPKSSAATLDGVEVDSTGGDASSLTAHLLCEDNASRCDALEDALDHLRLRVREIEKFELGTLIPGIMQRVGKLEPIIITLEKDRASMQQLHNDINEIFSLLPKSGFSEETKRMLKEHGEKLQNLFTTKADLDTVEKILRTAEAQDHASTEYVNDIFGKFEESVLTELSRDGRSRTEEFQTTMTRLRAMVVRKAEKTDVSALASRLDEFDTDDAAGMKRKLKPDRCLSCDRALPGGVGIQQPNVGGLHIGTIPERQAMTISNGRKGSPGAKVAYNRASYRDPESTPRLVNVNFRSPFTPSPADMQQLPYLSQSDRFSSTSSPTGARTPGRSPRTSRPATREGGQGVSRGAKTESYANRPVTAPAPAAGSGGAGLPANPKTPTRGGKRPSPPPR